MDSLTFGILSAENVHLLLLHAMLNQHKMLDLYTFGQTKRFQEVAGGKKKGGTLGVQITRHQLRLI